MKHVKIEHIEGPEYWAPYLINGDDSGLEPDEKEQADKWCKLNKIADVIDCAEESRFTWSYHLYNPFSDCRGGNVVEYTVILQ